MKKRGVLFLVLALLGVLLVGSLAGCNGNPADDGVEDPVYTGQFTYTMSRDGMSLQAHLVLEEGGTFYYQSEMMMGSILGTYEYNADKTQISLDSTNDDILDGTYAVEIDEDGLVVIKQLGYLAGNPDAENGLWADDFTYDTVNDVIEKPILDLVTFYMAGDENSYVTLQTENNYTLRIAQEDGTVLSRGTYAERAEGNSYTLTLTDSLNGSGDVYTLTYTYTEADGYSSILLKGEGIPADGIALAESASKTALGTLTGTAKSNMGTDETATLVFYDDNTFELTFTVYGNPGASATGTWELNTTTYNNVLTITGGVMQDYIAAENGIITLVLNYQTQLYSTEIAVNAALPNIGAFSYTMTLNQTGGAEEPEEEQTKMLVLEGSVAANNTTEKVTLSLYSKDMQTGTFTMSFTVFGVNTVEVTGTWVLDTTTYSKNTLTITDGAQKDWVGGDGTIVLSGVYNQETGMAWSGEVTISASEEQVGVPGVTLNYTVRLEQTWAISSGV